MKVREVMSRQVQEIAATATALDAATRMAEANVGMLVVTEKGHRVAGVITDRDLVTRCVARGATAQDHTVAEYMNARPAVVGDSLDLSRAVQVMHDRRCHRLPVIGEDMKLIGLLSLDDVAFNLGLYAESFTQAAGQYSRRARELEGALGE